MKSHLLKSAKIADVFKIAHMLSELDGGNMFRKTRQKQRQEDMVGWFTPRLG